MPPDARLLILMRHAKSSWDDPALDDHDRPLNRRGRLAATLMAAWLDDAGLRPDAARISTSRRTCETWARMTAAFGAAPPVEFLPDLYHAEPPALMGAVKTAPETARRLLILAHNPGLEPFAARLDPRRGPAAFPTSAVAVFELAPPLGGDRAAARWSDAAPGRFERVAAEHPKSLV